MALYRVKLSWSVQLSAPSAEAAHERVVKMMKDAPESFITGVESATLAKPRSILGRIITGK